MTENQNSLWFGSLSKKDDKWAFDKPGLRNLLAGTKLVSPVPPFGGAGDFDISTSGVIFVAKDPELNPARHTKTDLYFIPFHETKDDSCQLSVASAPQIVSTAELRGYTMSPSFSKDGKKVSFLRMKSDQYESDRPRLLIIPDISQPHQVEQFRKGAEWEKARPEWVAWAHDDSELYVAAEKHGRTVLWKLPADPDSSDEPEAIFSEGNVLEAKTLGSSSSLLVSSRSRIENSRYALLDIKDRSITEISSSSKRGRSFGLSQSQCSEIWYEGGAGYKNHALVMNPSHFDENTTYPLAFLIHGGPQSAWMDDWSTRWNPAIFAEQGYVVVCPNPTGSTGYGQDHVDAIAENWGGTPYEDLVRCFEFIEKNMNFVDAERAVALGASYGGYMISRFSS